MAPVSAYTVSARVVSTNKTALRVSHWLVALLMARHVLIGSRLSHTPKIGFKPAHLLTNRPLLLLALTVRTGGLYIIRLTLLKINFATSVCFGLNSKSQGMYRIVCRIFFTSLQLWSRGLLFCLTASFPFSFNC